MSQKEKELFKYKILKQIQDSTNPLRYLIFKNGKMSGQDRHKLICSEYELVICVEKDETKGSDAFHVSFWDINRIDLNDEEYVLDLSDKKALTREKCYRENFVIMGDGVQIDLSKYTIINNHYDFSLEYDLNSSPAYLQYDMVNGTFRTSSFDNGTEFRQLCMSRQIEDMVYIPFMNVIDFKETFLKAPWAWRLGMDRLNTVSEFFKTYDSNEWFLKPFVELMEKINYSVVPTNWI